MEWYVRLDNMGERFYLRSTIWTSDPERRTKFASSSEAAAGLAKAKKFTKPVLFKRAVVTNERIGA